MFSLIKQLFIVLMSFSESLATKWVSLNDEPCIIRPTLIDLNRVELKYYPFIISLGKCAGNFNILSSKICVSNETKEKWSNVDNEQLYTIFHVIINANSIVKHVIQIKNRIIKYVYVNAKIIIKCKKDYSCNPRTCICVNSKYLKVLLMLEWLHMMRLYLLWILYQQKRQIL